jgi:hypothetical protein
LPDHQFSGSASLSPRHPARVNGISRVYMEFTKSLCIGAYFVTGPVYFMMVHLNQQIYQIYLERGGEAVATSPTLRDDPPPLPV